MNMDANEYELWDLAKQFSSLGGIFALRLSYMKSDDLPPEDIYKFTQVKSKAPRASEEQIQEIVE